MNPLDRIREAVDLVEVVSRYVTLKKVGSRYIGLCPFHEDKASPSLSVQPEKQVWYCFGCQAGGNVYHFLTEIEGVKFQDAARMLSEETGISLDDDGRKRLKAYQKPTAVDLAHDAAFWWDHLAPSAGMELDILRRKDQASRAELLAAYRQLSTAIRSAVRIRRLRVDSLISAVERRLTDADDLTVEYVKFMEMLPG